MVKQVQINLNMNCAFESTSHISSLSNCFKFLKENWFILFYFYLPNYHLLLTHQNFVANKLSSA